MVWICFQAAGGVSAVWSLSRSPVLWTVGCDRDPTKKYFRLKMFSYFSADSLTLTRLGNVGKFFREVRLARVRVNVSKLSNCKSPKSISPKHLTPSRSNSWICNKRKCYKKLEKICFLFSSSKEYHFSYKYVSGGIGATVYFKMSKFIFGAVYQAVTSEREREVRSLRSVT